MSVISLLLLVALGCLLCWAVVRLPAPWRTAGIVAVVALLVLLSLPGLVPLRGQEAPTPVASATPIIAFADPSVVPAAAALPVPVATIVPAPPDATAAEVKAVAEQSAENLEAVADGEVSLAEATRDPTSGAPDPGSGGEFWLIAIVFGSVIRPITDTIVGRIRGLDDKLAGAINTAALLVTYLGAWALLHGSNPSLPQSAVSWAIAGFAAAGLGSATTGGIRAMNNKPAAP